MGAEQMAFRGGRAASRLQICAVEGIIKIVELARHPASMDNI